MEMDIDAREPTITRLPFEILGRILRNGRLKREDVESVRLSCRALEAAAAARLFYRISISKLRTDRHHFLSICSSPHLAVHVREVEWLEISCDGEIAKRITKPGADNDDCEDLNLRRDIDLPLQAECWLLNTPQDADDARSEASKQVRQAAVAEFTDTFQAAVDKLPNLRTFISRPMSSARVITSSGYPISASVLQTHQNLMSHPHVQTNDGLFFFLLPSMDRPTSAVTRLRWVDEFPGRSYTRAVPPSSLERLESLDLCLHPNDWDTSHLADFSAACQRAAPALRHLTVCMDHGFPRRHLPISAPELMLLGPNGLATARECALQSLTLDSVCVSSEELKAVIKANARSLRHLRIDGSGVKANVISSMRELTDLTLDTIQLGDEWKEAHHVVDSRALVQYVNGEEHETPDFRRVRTCVDKAERDKGYWATTDNPLDQDQADEDSDDDEEESSDSELDHSVDYRHRHAPKWAWGRFFHRHCGPGYSYLRDDIYCWRVNSTDTSETTYATTTWRFTSRDGRVAYGDDPHDWFEDWDPAAGDREEPTPFGYYLTEFADQVDVGTVHDYLGATHHLLGTIEPPEGAILYDKREDPTAIKYGRW